ncbi:MAG: InlB B-repeat-containing protein [Defluviitaleaceae bacterium]|nr:InlB B-repeat-containing protein [Defluviitaleaceae bacterium]
MPSKEMFKKFVALMMVFFIVLSVMPVTVFNAEAFYDSHDDISSEAVSGVDEFYYNHASATATPGALEIMLLSSTDVGDFVELQNAINDVSVDMIRIIDDIAMTAVLTINREMTIIADDDFSITTNQLRHFNINASGVLNLGRMGDTHFANFSGGRHSSSTHAGGSILIENGGTLNMWGGEIFNNTSYSGGAVAVLGTFNMYDGVIRGNSATSGGGVFIENGGVFSLLGGRIENNDAPGFGGGVHVFYLSRFDMSGTAVISGNTSGTGGGVFVLDSEFNMQGGLIDNNTSAGQGGGVVLADLSIVNNTLFNMSNGVISNNNAGTFGGGLAARDRSEFNLAGGTLLANEAAYDGGGVWMGAYARLNMSSGTISGNLAQRSGGGIRAEWQTVITITGGLIDDNEASGGDGGGIFSGAVTSAQPGRLLISGGTISNNRVTFATGRGGGIYSAAGAASFPEVVNIGHVNGIDTSASIHFTGNSTVIPPRFYDRVTGNGVFGAHIRWNGWNVSTQSTSVVGNEVHLLNGYDIDSAATIHTVTFILNGGTSSAIPAQDVLEHTMVTRPTDPTRSHYVFQGWFTAPTGGAAWNFNNVVTSSFNLYAQWQPRSYNVTFDLASGTHTGGQSLEQAVLYNTNAILPTGVSRVGHDFASWTPANGHIAVNSDRTITATWTPRNYTVSFNVNGGNLPAPVNQTIPFGTLVTMPPTPTRTGYTFSGWFMSGDGVGNVSGVGWNFASDTMPDMNITLYAGWNVNYYTVIFDTNIPGTIAGNITQVVVYNYPANEPSTPIREGFNFTGWYTARTGGTLWNFANPVTSDRTLYARWEARTYTVTIDLDGGNVSGDSSLIVRTDVPHGSNIVLPDNPRKQGYTFVGWLPVNGHLNITSDITITAQWMLVTAFDLQVYGGKREPQLGYLPANTVATVLIDELPMDNRIFTHFTFYNMDDGYNEVTHSINFFAGSDMYAPYSMFFMPPHNTLVIAHYINPHTIYFNLNASSIAPAIPSYISPQYVHSGAQVIRPTDPVREMYRLRGWRVHSSTGVLWNFNDSVSSSMILFASWIGLIEVEENETGGGNVSRPPGWIVDTDNETGIITVTPSPSTPENDIDVIAIPPGWTWVFGRDDDNNVIVIITPPRTGSGGSGGGGSGGGGGGTPTSPPSTTIPNNTDDNNLIDLADPGITIITDGLVIPANLDDDGFTFYFNAEELTPFFRYTGVHVIEIYGFNPVGLRLPIDALRYEDLEIVVDFGAVLIPNASLQNMRNLMGDTFHLFMQSTEFGMIEMRLINESGMELPYHYIDFPLFVRIPMLTLASEDAVGYVAINMNSADTIMPYSVLFTTRSTNASEVVFATQSTGRFRITYNPRYYNDTSAHWATEYINFVSARELFQGVGDNSFAPNIPMTRGMFAQVLANIYRADLTLVANISDFDDVDIDSWYALAITWAASTGKLQGYGDGTFGPMDYITREQMAVMMANYIQFRNHDMPSNPTMHFEDDSQISAWAYDSVRFLQETDILLGRPGYVFEPQNIATRAEVAAVFTRLIEVYVQHMVHHEYYPLRRNPLAHGEYYYAAAMIDRREDFEPVVDEDSIDDDNEDNNNDTILSLEELDEIIYEDGVWLQDYR